MASLTVDLKEGSNYFQPGVHEVSLSALAAVQSASTPYISLTFSSGSKEFNKRYYFSHPFSELERANGKSESEVTKILGYTSAGKPITDPRKTSTFISLESLKHLLVSGKIIHPNQVEGSKLFDKISFSNVELYVADLLKLKIQGKKLKINLIKKLNTKDGKNYTDFSGFPFACGINENTLIPAEDTYSSHKDSPSEDRAKKDTSFPPEEN